ncbi:hypothetical protein Hanom_Chr03g00231201 [Helianthus anomalus]
MTRPQQCSVDDFFIVVDSIEDLLLIDWKFKSGDVAGEQSSRSVGSKEQLSGAIPMSNPAKEEFEIDPIPELTMKNTLKRQREKSKPDPVPGAKKVLFRKSLIGKKANLGSWMAQISPNKCSLISHCIPWFTSNNVFLKLFCNAIAKAAQPKIRIIHPKHAPKAPSLTSAGATKKVEGAPEVTREKVVEPGVEILHVEGATPSSGPVKSAGTFERVEKHVADTDVAGEGVSTFSAQHKEPSPIRPKDTLGNHYYRSYNSSRADEIHAPVWSLKQGDTFATFPTCREWFMGAFPPAEVLHQKKRKHEQLYQSHLFAQANHAKAELAEQASEDTLAEERRKWREECNKENEKMYSTRNEITNLKAHAEISAKTITDLSAQNENLTRSHDDLEERFEVAKVHRERAEQNQVRIVSICAQQENEIHRLTLLSTQEIL